MIFDLDMYSCGLTCVQASKFPKTKQKHVFTAELLLYLMAQSFFDDWVCVGCLGYEVLFDHKI